MAHAISDAGSLSKDHFVDTKLSTSRYVIHLYLSPQSLRKGKY